MFSSNCSCGGPLFGHDRCSFPSGRQMRQVVGPCQLEPLEVDDGTHLGMHTRSYKFFSVPPNKWCSDPPLWTTFGVTPINTPNWLHSFAAEQLPPRQKILLRDVSRLACAWKEQVVLWLAAWNPSREPSKAIWPSYRLERMI